ncbi:MAG: hypothetical protein LBF84_01235 [Holosporales bacterium]|nr:hypothetical protein [Holosporales bacterium]
MNTVDKFILSRITMYSNKLLKKLVLFSAAFGVIAPSMTFGTGQFPQCPNGQCPPQGQYGDPNLQGGFGGMPGQGFPGQPGQPGVPGQGFPGQSDPNAPQGMPPQGMFPPQQ